MRTLRFGHSPDADDAFMFYGIAQGKAGIDGYAITHALQDIETLNKQALKAELEVTAISAAFYPHVAQSYRVLACGASVGRSYGPIVVARQPMERRQLHGKRIAVPGRFTTAFALASIYLEEFTPVVLPFDAIMEAVADGSVDAGVIIHEGQITYKGTGLAKLLDLGQEWSGDTGLPIPLGLDVVRRDLGEAMAQEVFRVLRDSILYARANEDAAIAYALQFGRGLDAETCRRFVRMYVNDDTVNMGQEGERALEVLYRRCSERGIIATLPPLDIVGLG